MKGYNDSGTPFIDLEKAGLLVFRDFARLKNRMLVGSALSRQHFFSGMIGNQETTWKPGPAFELLSMTRKILENPQHPEHALVKELGVKYGAEYLKLKYPTVYIGSSLSIANAPASAYQEKHLAERMEWRPGSENFPFIKEEIEAWNVFESFGRIVLFMNEHHSYTPIHRDWHNQDEFVWVPLTTQKKFFVYDEEANAKHFVTGRAVTFNNSDYHGSEPSPYAALSLRVDGIFKPEVRARLAELVTAR